MSEIQYQQITQKICDFISSQVDKTRSKGIVFGLSGGIDSVVTAFLCQRALGQEKCLAILLPNKDITPNSETNDAIDVATSLDIPYKICNIQSITEKFKSESKLESTTLADGNLLARIRSNMIYYHANSMNYLVAGTDDKSEYLIGYFTKYGDGASDILPIKQLYKTQVQKLGEYLGVPQKIVKKIPGPHLWKEHNSMTEIGVSFDVIDKILASYFEKNMSSEDISSKEKIEQKIVDKILTLHKNSQHKRKLQPYAILD